MNKKILFKSLRYSLIAGLVLALFVFFVGEIPSSIYHGEVEINLTNISTIILGILNSIWKAVLMTFALSSIIQLINSKNQYEKNRFPRQTKLIGYFGYTVSFVLLGTIIYKIIVMPLLVMMSEEYADENVMVYITAEIISDILIFGLLSVIIFKVSKALFNRKKWSIILCTVFFLWWLFLGFTQNNFIVVVISTVFFVASASAINHPFYNKKSL
ncbi:MAG: hypothetical protein AB7J46_01545 [Candidatus Altimarinota bacterium]